MSDGKEETRDSQDQVEHPNARYEGKDVRFGCILSLLIAAGCYLAFHFTLIRGFFRYEDRIHTENGKSQYRLMPTPSAELPPEPRLEQLNRMENKSRETADDRQGEMERLLHSHGPTADRGFVHIPIEEAMKKIVEQLPIREQPPDHGKDRGLLDDGQPNSGRVFRGALP
jgi:hypothetical protein